MVFFSHGDDVKASEKRIEKETRKQDRKNNPEPEDPESPYQTGDGWLKTAAEVQEIWGACRLCWRVAVIRDDGDDIIGTKDPRLVLAVDRYDGRLFVMEFRLINTDISMSKARDLCDTKLGARCAEEREGDVLEAEDWQEVVLFKDLPWDISNRHVLRYRYVEVSENDYFKVVEGKLCGEWLSLEVQEKGKRAGGWNRCSKDGKLHPPPRATDAHEDISSLAPANTAAIPGELFPEKVHKQAAADAERNAIKLKPVIKSDGHATLVKPNGETLGGNPTNIAAALSSVGLSRKHEAVKAKNLVSYLNASNRDANSSVSQLKGEKKRKREKPVAEEAAEWVDKEAEWHKVQESQAGRKKAKTTKVKDTSDAKTGASETEAEPQVSSGKLSLLGMFPSFGKGRK